jgi:hypothetical protein
VVLTCTCDDSVRPSRPAPSSQRHHTATPSIGATDGVVHRPAIETKLDPPDEPVELTPHLGLRANSRISSIVPAGGNGLRGCTPQIFMPRDLLT